MIDELATWGHRPPVVVADAGYGEVSPFRTGLTARGIGYVVAVKATTSVHRADAAFGTPPYSGRGRPPVPGYLDAPTQVQALVTSLAEADPQAVQTLSWRTGTRQRRDNPRGLMSSRFIATRVRPANRTIPTDPDGTLPECWLLAEWPATAEKPTDYWLSTLPETTTIATLVRLAKIRWRIEHDYRELKHGLGLDHFEGAHLARLAPPRHPGHRSAPVHHHPAPHHRPKSTRGSLSFYQTLAYLQTAVIANARQLPLLQHPRRTNLTKYY